jgi:hypothetical protein
LSLSVLIGPVKLSPYCGRRFDVLLNKPKRLHHVSRPHTIVSRTPRVRPADVPIGDVEHAPGVTSRPSPEGDHLCWTSRSLAFDSQGSRFDTCGGQLRRAANRCTMAFERAAVRLLLSAPISHLTSGLVFITAKHGRHHRTQRRAQMRELRPEIRERDERRGEMIGAGARVTRTAAPASDLSAMP